MSRRITGEGRLVVTLAGEQARRLGHGFLGCEHLLYGLASVDSEAGTVLRARGITPQRYEEEFVNLVGPHRLPAPAVLPPTRSTVRRWRRSVSTWMRYANGSRRHSGPVP